MVAFSDKYFQSNKGKVRDIKWLNYGKRNTIIKNILYKTIFLRNIEKQIFKAFCQNFLFLNNRQNIRRLNFKTMNLFMLKWTSDFKNQKHLKYESIYFCQEDFRCIMPCFHQPTILILSLGKVWTNGCGAKISKEWSYIFIKSLWKVWGNTAKKIGDTNWTAKCVWY